MSDTSKGPRLAVYFADEFWRTEVERLGRGSRARVAAESARRILERDGAAMHWLESCEAAAADGTRLPGYLKLKVPPARPPSEAPFGFVLDPLRDEEGVTTLVAVAFGERHPHNPATRSVYERAHNRLHGAWPSRA